MSHWVISAWRRQCRRRTEVDAALREARALGLKSYAVVRQGKWFWVVCGAQTSTIGALDLASVVRSFYRNIEQGVYLAAWQGTMVCVAWQQQRLTHCCAWPRETFEHVHLAVILQQIGVTSAQSSVILLATELLPHWQDYCQREHPRWQVKTQQPLLSALPLHKVSRLQPMTQPPLWQQRQRLMLAALLVLCLATVVTWWFWPKTSVPQVGEARVLAPYIPVGVAATVLAELPRLLHGVAHLAGWRWQSTALQGAQLVTVVTASYGRVEELQAQLPSYWRVAGQNKTVQLHYPIVANAPFQAAAATTPWSWSERYQALFPQATLRPAAVQQDLRYQWQDFHLQLPATSVAELQRLAATLDAPHLRLVTLKLTPQSNTMSAELVVRVYRHLPPSLQGEST